MGSERLDFQTKKQSDGANDFGTHSKPGHQCRERQSETPVGALLEETIDVSECWLGASIPIFQKRAAEAGLTIDWIEYADFNFDIYGNGLVTSDRMIADNPDLVRRFVEAAFRGYDYVVEHTEEAAAIIVGLHPVLDKDIVLQQL